MFFCPTATRYKRYINREETLLSKSKRYEEIKDYEPFIFTGDIGGYKLIFIVGERFLLKSLELSTIEEG